MARKRALNIDGSGVRTLPQALSLLIVAMASAGTAWAQAPLRQLSLDDAIRLTAENQSLRARNFDLKAKQAAEITAGLRPNPQFSYSPSTLTPLRSVDNTLSVAQTFETMGKRDLRVQSARADTRISGFQVQDFERQLAFQVKSTFVSALVAKTSLEFAQDNLKSLDEVERLQRLRFQKGDLSGLDLVRLEGQRYDFERDAADARNSLQSAKTTLRTIAPDRIAEQFEIKGDLVYREFAPARPDLMRVLMANRPDLKAADAARDKSQIDIDLARANAYPDITPSIGYTRTHDGQDLFGVSISVPLPVFDRNQGERARVAADAARIQAERAATYSQAAADLDTALSNFGTARQKVTLLRETYVPKAKEARDRTETAYRRGAVSLLDFLDAERTYRSTTLNYIQSLGDYWTAVYQIEAATGSPVQP